MTVVSLVDLTYFWKASLLFYHCIITYTVQIMTSLRTSLSVSKTYPEICSSTASGGFVDLRL